MSLLQLPRYPSTKQRQDRQDLLNKLAEEAGGRKLELFTVIHQMSLLQRRLAMTRHGRPARASGIGYQIMPLSRNDYDRCGSRED